MYADIRFLLLIYSGVRLFNAIYKNYDIILHL